MRPAIVELPGQAGPMLHETFAPILYVVPYDQFDDAIAMNNAVAHGLSSAVFTQDLREAERFTSARGSDCGVATLAQGPPWAAACALHPSLCRRNAGPSYSRIGS